MEENLITQIKMYLDTKNPDTRIEVKKLFAKEYIHAYILDFLYNSKNYHTINFYEQRVKNECIERSKLNVCSIKSLR